MAALLLDALQHHFVHRGNEPALKHQHRIYNYAELHSLVAGGAARLQSLGLSKADRVILATSNKLALLVGHLATLWAGGISVPLNPRFTREELRFFFSDSGARIAIVDAEVRPVLESLQPELPDLRILLPDASILESHKPWQRDLDIAAGDPCLMIYSSGTTGWPKGIVHTHANLGSSLRALQTCWRFTPDDVVLNVLPLFHIHGLAFATLLSLMSGGCVVLDDFEPRRTMNALASCTVFMAVPTIYYRFLEEPEFRAAAEAWQRVRLFTCGSAPMRAEVLPELEAIVGRPIINRYGMSEAFVITSLPLDGPWPHGSVGLPLDGIDVRVLVDGEKTAGPGEVGSVQLRGPNLFREYWRQPEATRAAFATGWFDTGDLGFRDDAGFLTLVGRKNDLIITSGFNVYPQVVERVINNCPGVRESAVFGVPDMRKGERVAVAVVRDDLGLDENRLREFWSERLVDYQRPRDIVFVDALPRNSMGKVLRRTLREWIEKG